MQLLKTLKWHVWLTLHFYLTARSRENAANILMYFPHCACLQLRSPAPSYKPMCDFSGLIPRQGFPWQPHQESCGPGPRLGTQLGHPSLCRESRSLVSGLLASQALHIFTSLTLVFKPRSPSLRSWAEVFQAPQLRPLCGVGALPLLPTGTQDSVHIHSQFSPPPL